jgi:hypothetical protein
MKHNKSFLQVENLVLEIRKDCDWKKLTTECENRALPLKTSELEMIRRKNLKLSSSAADSTELPSEESAKLKDEKKSEKSVARQLYDLLFSPIEDILSKLPKESPLIIIPDKALHQCPFNILQDFLNRYAFKRFRITYLPNILLLDKVVGNELNRLRLKDDLDFERHVHKHGGMANLMNQYGGKDSGIASVSSGEGSAHIVNAKRLSHPRLLSRPSRHQMSPPHPGVLPKQVTMFEEDMKKHLHHGKSPRTPRGEWNFNF